MGSFIIQGARQTGTLTIIRDFIRCHKKGVLLLDEMDKASTKNATDPWYFHIAAEVLTLLDASDRLMVSGWNRDDIKRLRSFMIIGAGAWQDRVGPDSQDKSGHLASVRAEPRISEEVLLRFNSRFIYVSPPTKQDYLTAFRRVYGDLELPLPAEDQLGNLVSSAIASRSGMRAVEQHVTDLLCTHARLRRPTKAAVPVSSTETSGSKEAPSTIVSNAVYDRHRQEVSRLMEELEAPLAHLQALFRLHEPSLARVRAECPDEKSGEPVSPGDLNTMFMDFIEALHFFYSINSDQRDLQQKLIWVLGNRLLQVVWNASLLEAAYLEEHGHLALITSTQARLSRLLAVWRFFTTLRPEEA
jgi:hypothetical protein